MPRRLVAGGDQSEPFDRRREGPGRLKFVGLKSTRESREARERKSGLEQDVWRKRRKGEKAPPTNTLGRGTGTIPTES